MPTAGLSDAKCACATLGWRCAARNAMVAPLLERGVAARAGATSGARGRAHRVAVGAPACGSPADPSPDDACNDVRRDAALPSACSARCVMGCGAPRRRWRASGAQRPRQRPPGAAMPSLDRRGAALARRERGGAAAQGEKRGRELLALRQRSWEVRSMRLDLRKSRRSPGFERAEAELSSARRQRANGRGGGEPMLG